MKFKFEKIDSYNPRIELCTLLDDGEPTGLNKFVIRLFNCSFTWTFKEIIKPFNNRTYNYFSKNYYDNYLERRYGISIVENSSLFVYYGIYNDNCYDSKYNSKLLILNFNWKDYTYVHKYIFNKERKIIWFENQQMKIRVPDIDSFDFVNTMSDADKYYFKFKDYDGEEIIATCHLTQRKWTRGRNEFSWLKYFTKPLIINYLEIEYSSEVGTRKGSWKGGIVGTSVELLSEQEDAVEAFKRHCLKYNLTFIDQ